ncbi:hypothetical protein [Streptomyces sp. NPDC059122]|uniref:hypothetical protein n=1 Tax=unclassified Streptomyces TaxID=2593676 RepID=UPI003682DD2D
MMRLSRPDKHSGTVGQGPPAVQADRAAPSTSEFPDSMVSFTAAPSAAQRETCSPHQLRQ